MEPIPTQIGRYRILQKLASGGMGEVFLARQEGPAGFNKPAVVKRILSHLRGEQRFVQMFLQEARLAAVLSHPNIVQIFELGEADCGWFIAMEYLHGRSLRAVREEAVARGELFPPGQAARIMVQALEGLHYAHTARGANGEPLNIVHRDVSPENVFVCFNGTVKVLDFGIAKAADGITTTQAGQVKGKFAYMAPEQLLAHPLDGRADVFGAGVVLYETLAGDRPFTDATESATMNRILTGLSVPLEYSAKHVPHALSDLVMKAVRKRREDRFESAEEFRVALEKFMDRTNEPFSNAATAAFLKHLFGDLSQESPAMVTSRPDLLAVSASPPDLAEVSVDGKTALRGQSYENLPPVVSEPRPSSPPPTRRSGADEILFSPEPEALTGPPGAEPAAVPAPAEAPPELAIENPAEAPRRKRSRLPAIVIALAVIAAAGGALVLGRGDPLGPAGNLSITSDPPGATVHIGGQQRGITPWYGPNTWTGTTGYELTAQGYEVERGSFPGRHEVKLNVKLTRKARK